MGTARSALMGTARSALMGTTRSAWISVGLPVFALYAVASGLRYEFFGSGPDLTIFYQALATTGEVPFETAIKGPGSSIFGDHFHPIILLLWPLLKIFPSPLTLLIVQAACIAAAVTMLVVQHRQEHPDAGPGFALVLALSPGVQGAAMYDFHEICLAAPLLVGWVWLLRRQRIVAATGCALALLPVQEYLVLFVAGIAVVHWLRRHRRSAVVLAVAAVSWWFVVTNLVIPRFWKAGYVYDGLLPTEAGQAARNLLAAVVWPGLQTLTVVALLTTFAWRSLRSSLVWAVVPCMAAFTITTNFRYHVFYYHYYLLPVLLLAAAAMDAPAFPAPRRWLRRLAVVVCVAGVVAGPVVTSLATTPWTDRADALAAIDQVPRGARVAADPGLTARLATKTRVSQLRPPAFVDGRGKPMDDVTWVIINENATSFSGGWAPQMKRVLASEGFTEVGRHGAYLVLTR